ncbi:MAG: response regulator [Planctomycetota bacterium]
MRDVYTTGQVAKICNVTIRTVIRWFESGLLEGYKIPGSRDRRIPHESLVRFMRQHQIPLAKLEGAGRKRVLIADDDEGIVAVLQEQFERFGFFEVHTATSGYDAGLKTARLRPNLLLLDYLFGDTTGEEVARSIRADPSLSHVRIIVMSAHLGRDEAWRLIDAGEIDAYLPKPLDFVVLRNTVLELLQLA